MDEIKQYSKDLLKFLNNAPTPFQSVELLEEVLVDAEAVKLDETKNWDLKKDTLYYFTKADSQIAAFRISGDPIETGLRIGIAHHDSPGFRIKSVPSKIDLGYERLCLEGYGGMIVHTWLDRPLALAGRCYICKDGKISAKNINIRKPLLIIPSAAIHVVREVNDGAKFNIQTDMMPFFAQNSSGEVRFTSYLAKQLKCKPEEIVSYELSPYEYSPGSFVGEDEEFISAPRLDDASLAYNLIRGLCDSKSGCDIACVFDHEEIGSNSDRGAKSNTLMMIIDRICNSFGYNADDKYRILAGSIAFSADMAHATHPSYAYRSDPNLIVKLNKGPVLKLAARQSYSTSSKGSAYFKMLCKTNNIPYQEFNNRSDAAGGGTIGPVVSSALGIVTVDIGNPQLSMHSIRELGGTNDAYYMMKLLSAFFSEREGI